MTANLSDITESKEFPGIFQMTITVHVPELGAFRETWDAWTDDELITLHRMRQNPDFALVHIKDRLRQKLITSGMEHVPTLILQLPSKGEPYSQP